MPSPPLMLDQTRFVRSTLHTCTQTELSRQPPNVASISEESALSIDDTGVDHTGHFYCIREFELQLDGVLS